MLQEHWVLPDQRTDCQAPKKQILVGNRSFWSIQEPEKHANSDVFGIPCARNHGIYKVWAKPLVFASVLHSRALKPRYLRRFLHLTQLRPLAPMLQKPCVLPCFPVAR